MRNVSAGQRRDKRHGVRKSLGSVVCLPWCCIEASGFLFGDFVTV